MLGLKLLIIDTPWTAITEASIRQNWPDKDYEITTGDMATIISNALHCAEGEITMVVRGGVVLEINAGDLPPLSKLKNYHLCAARSQVYSDHPSLSRFYDYTETNRNKGHFDLSVFIINPAMWGDVPEKTRGILRDKKILCMPRYMNHKEDVLIDNCVSPYVALQYGMLGSTAAVFNYVDILNKGTASVIEGYAYRFDKLAKYSDDPLVQTLASKSSALKLRQRLGKALEFTR